ncbi:MAG: lysophospholipase [Bdellovibrionota bacterium]
MTDQDSNPVSTIPHDRLEAFFSAADHTKLYYQRWKPVQSRGTLVITHGQGEHSESYHRVVEALAPLHLDIWSWDMRGHGKSEGKRGFANSAEEYYKDYVEFMEKVIFVDRSSEANQKNAKLPLFLLAHSMGGMIQLLALERHPRWKITAQVCSAPLLGVAVAVPKVKEVAAQVMAQAWPKLTLGNEITNDMVTRDVEVMKEFESDIYRHGRISSGVYVSFNPLMAEVATNAKSIKVPTLFQLPENDPVVSTPAARAVFKDIGTEEKTLLLYGDGARHEMYNDTHRATVLADLRRYLQNYIPTKGSL